MPTLQLKVSSFEGIHYTLWWFLLLESKRLCSHQTTDVNHNKYFWFIRRKHSLMYMSKYSHTVWKTFFQLESFVHFVNIQTLWIYLHTICTLQLKVSSFEANPLRMYTLWWFLFLLRKRLWKHQVTVTDVDHNNIKYFDSEISYSSQYSRSVFISRASFK